MCLLELIVDKLEDHLARYKCKSILNVTVECRCQRRVNLKVRLQRYKGDDIRRSGDCPLFGQFCEGTV
jgi:hypothetical protein